MGIWDELQKGTGTTTPVQIKSGGLWDGINQNYAGDNPKTPVKSTPKYNIDPTYRPLSPRLSTGFAQSTKAVDFEVANPAIEIPKFLGDAVVSAVGRAGLKAALTVDQYLADRKGTEGLGTITKEDIGKLGPIDVGKIVIGDDPVTPLQKDTPEAINALRQGGYGKASPIIGFLGTTGAVALDLIPFGSLSTKTALKLSEELTELGVKGILKSELPDLAIQLEKNTEVWDDLAKALAKEKNPENIDKTLRDVISKVNGGKNSIPADLEPLAEEARKYKSPEEFISTLKKEKPEYAMSHRPSETGAIASDISKNSEVIPKDFYDHPEWYGNMKEKSYQESFTVLQRIRNKPDAEITIYRSSPKNELRNGDWITLSKTYADEEGLKEGVKTYSFKVKAKDIQFAGDDFNEFGYFPSKDTLTDIWNKANRTVEKTPVYPGETDLTTKILKNLEGKSTVSKQYITDLSKGNDIKQAERNIILRALEDEGDKISVQNFANKVKTELLPLKLQNSDIYNTKLNDPNGMLQEGNFTPKYEHITLPDELRGPVYSYKENIYESPISTSAGVHHFEYQTKNYFAHSRIEDLPPNGSRGTRIEKAKTISGADYEITRAKEVGDTRRVIEIQSDLFQKGRLEGEAKFGAPKDIGADAEFSRLSNREMQIHSAEDPARYADELAQIQKDKKKLVDSFAPRALAFKATRDAELSKLEPYRNTWWERVVREEVKQAAIDGKTKLQFPTGETAMKIEGLGSQSSWNREVGVNLKLRPQDIKVGKTIGTGIGNDPWIIVEDLGNGKFKAIDITNFPMVDEDIARGDFRKLMGTDDEALIPTLKQDIKNYAETFDISGKVDTENPIYKFYEKDLGKYLKNKYSAELITDAQGVKWWQFNVNPHMKDAPVEAFGGFAGFEQDENGKLHFDPKKAVLGIIGMTVARNKVVRPEVDKLFKEFSSIAKGKLVSDPEKLIDSGLKLSDEAAELFGTKASTISFTRKTIKHLAEKGEEGERLLKAVPEVLSNPEEVRRAKIADRFLVSAKIASSQEGRYSTVILEIEKRGDSIIVTSFDADKKYLETFELLWRTAASGAPETIPPYAYPRGDAGGRAEFSAHKATQNLKGTASSISNRLNEGKGLLQNAFSIKDTPAKEAYETATTKIVQNEVDANEGFKSFDFYNQILDEDRFINIRELQSQRDELAYVLSQDPARELGKYANKWGELAEVGGQGTGGKWARSGDEIAADLGYKSSDDARAAYSKYLTKKGELDALEDSLRSERPFLRERSALVRLLNKNKVKGTEQLSEMASLISGNPNVKDISNFSAGARDLYRNFEVFFGKHYGQVKKTVLDRFDDAKGLYVDEQKRLVQELKDNITDKFGFEKGSEESRAIMDLGEGEIVADDVIRMFGTEKGNQIIEATQWFRGMYDTLLDEVNAVIKKIYPNRPEKIIPKRPDYFRHFTELRDGLGALKNIFESQAGISPTLAGLSDFTAPKQKFLSFAQRRLGIQTKRDAIGGFLDYIPSFAYAKHIDPQISVFRALKKDIIRGVQDSDNPKALNVFAEYLHDFSNDLAGKTNPLDRASQKWIPGGRKTFKVIDWLSRRIKANVILGNTFASVAQAFNIPQGVASAKPKYSILGAKRALAGIVEKNTPASNSIFLKERYFKDYNQFEKGILKNTKKFAVWVTGALDEVGTKFIWNAHYEKAIGDGIEDPVRYADGMTRKLVAGRGVGEVPLIQKSKLFQLVAPFQLEVANLWWVMKDFVKEKDFSAIALLLVGNYLMNRVAEHVRGSDVVFDPIQATIDAVNTLQDENDVGDGMVKAGGRIVGEVLSNVPLGQTLASWVPEYGIKVGTIEIPPRKELFGQEGDPTRFGTGALVIKGLKDPIFKVVPGFGGGQLKKTYEGLQAWFKSAVDDKSGKEMYEVDRSLPNLLRLGLFGAYASPEAREYFNRTETKEARIIREEKEKAKEKTDVIKDDAENTWRSLKKMPKEEGAAVFEQLAQEQPEVAKKITQIWKDEERGLTYNDRQLLSAGVENGARAQAILKLLDLEPTKEAKADMWDALVKKKIITKAVAEQLNTLLANE